MSNIIISELRPDESFLTELESDVLTANIVGGGKEYKPKKYGKKKKKGYKKFKQYAKLYFDKIKYSVIVAGNFYKSPVNVQYNYIY